MIINTIVTLSPELLIQQLQQHTIFGAGFTEYNYKNHAYLCYLLNKLNINIFDEQNAIFAEKLYKNIRQGVEYTYNGDKIITHIPGSCYWIDPEIISKYELWQFYDNMEDSRSDKFYQQLPQAVSSLISVICHL
jgi:uncharacterized UPF0160 family protein